ncbi:MAG: DUF349 domain-containing protein [Gammaproteobacteria bacterium]|nr:DUF349 domain-containing protein [Gammaproteobacteria bacterium]
MRKQALQALDAKREETQTILLDIASNDPQLFIRRLAIKRLTGIDAVQALRQAGARDEIYQEATRRLCVLLSAEEGTNDIEQLKSRLSQLAEAGILEYVARHAVIPDLQKYALERIDNENVVVDVITGAVRDDIRHYALSKLNNAAALKRVIKLLKRKDKKFAAQAQEKLDRINAALVQRNELANEYKRIGNDFLELVELCKLSNEWRKYEARLRSLHEQWRGAGIQLDQQANSTESGPTLQIAQAYALFEEQLKESAKKQAWEVSPEVTHADAIDRLRVINEQLTAKVGEISQQQAGGSGLARFAADIKRQWQQCYNEIITDAGAALPFADLPQMTAEFEAGLKELEQWRADFPTLEKYNAQLNELIANARELLDSGRTLSGKDIATLEKRFENLVPPRRFAIESQLIESYKNTLGALQQALARQEEKRRHVVSEFTALNKQLADSIADGKSKQASQLISRGRKLLKQLDDAGKSILEKDGQSGHFNQLALQVSELHGWRQWSSTPVKEQQISEMLELARELEANQDNPHYDFVTAANTIKAARKEWQNLTTGEADGDQGLWQQFDAACNQAYAVCQRHFDQQAEHRAINLQKRELFCQDLEAYQQKIAGQEPENIDWKAMNKIVYAARKDWGQLGIVNRGDRAKINKRFNHVLHALDKQLHQYQLKNSDTKEVLNRRVQTLQKQVADKSVSVEQAIESVKQAQVEWKAAGAAIKESQLWRQFREACDSVFQMQRAEQDAINQAREAEKLQREQIIAAVEAAGTLSNDAILQVRATVEKSKSEWEELPRLKKDNTQERRFSRAFQQFEKQLARYFAQQLQMEKQKLQQNVALCYALEKTIFACLQGQISTGQLKDSVADLQQRWAPVDARLRQVEQAVRGRFEHVKTCAERCGNGDMEAVRSQLTADENTCMEVKDLLCIQMELLADIESPPESRQRRMEYQVAQLAQKMKQPKGQDIDAEIARLLSQWHSSGFMDPAKAQPLEQRFYSALQSLDKDYQ